MTPCRARTTRGDPVTFEFHDHGEVESHDNVRKIARELVSEMVGEGFHCVSGHRFEGADGRSRMEFDRQSLERAGIDTTTAEVWDEHIWNEIDSRWVGTTQRCRGTLGGWSPMFPAQPKPHVAVEDDQFDRVAWALCPHLKFMLTGKHAACERCPEKSYYSRVERHGSKFCRHMADKAAKDAIEETEK